MEARLNIILDIMYVLIHVAVAIVFLAIAGLIFTFVFPNLSEKMLEEEEKKMEHED